MHTTRPALARQRWRAAPWTVALSLAACGVIPFASSKHSNSNGRQFGATGLRASSKGERPHERLGLQPGLSRMTNSDLLRAVRDAAADEFDVLGEIARDGDKTVVFLARDLETAELVALKLTRGEPDQSGPDQYVVEIVHELDASMPDIDSYCPRCGSKLRRWARFCTQCGIDVSGIGPSSRENLSRDTLRHAVRAAAQSEYEVLGEMPRAEGGGLVYFARDRKSNNIVALRLQKESESEYALDVTRVLKPVAGVGYAGAAPLSGSRVPEVGREAQLSASDRPPSGASSPVAPKPSGSGGLRALLEAGLGRVNPVVAGSLVVAIVVILVLAIVLAST